MNSKPLTRLAAVAIALAMAFSGGTGTLSGAATATRYKVIDVGTLGGSFSQAFSVNGLAQVAGTSGTTGDATAHAFLWTNGKIRDLGNLPGGSTSGAAAVNLFGQVTGESDNADTDPNPFLCFTPNECRAFLWQNGRMKDLAPLRGGRNSAGGWINDFGLVVGASETTTANDPVNGFPPFHATAWVLGVPIDLGTLGGAISIANSVNDLGQVVGNSQFNDIILPGADFPAFHGFLFDRGRMIDLSAGGGLGGHGSDGDFINNRRQVVGDAELPGDTGIHAILWQNGLMTDLGVIEDDPDSSATAIDDTGRIVGWSGNDEDVFRAALWKNGVATDLNSLVPATTDLYLLIATSVSDNGAIAGFGVSQATGEFHAFLLVPQFGNASSNAIAPQSQAIEGEPDSASLQARAPIHVKLPENLRRSTRTPLRGRKPTL